MNLADATVLSFGCHGTLIDWETGLTAAPDGAAQYAWRCTSLAEFATALSQAKGAAAAG